MSKHAPAQKNQFITEGDGFADIKLSRPVEMNGAKVSQLRMREPTVGDQERAGDSGGSDTQREIMLFSSLCEVSPDDIRNMGMRDYMRLQQAYTLFIA